jgi:hypothetical protein
MPTDNKTLSGGPDLSEEHELTGYVDGLISAAIAKRKADAPLESVATEPAEIDGSETLITEADCPAPAGPEIQESAPIPSLVPALEQAPTPEPALGPEPAKPVRPARRPSATRASMSENLLELFRSTEPRPAPSMSAPIRDRSESSPYLTRYLQRAERSPELAPSGLTRLDERLGGGFSPGLHVLQGKSGAGKTTFLQSVALEAVASGRPVRDYALKEGSLGLWERLVSSFSHILGGPPIPLSALRAHTLAPGELEALAGVDLALKDSVLAHLSLIETVSPHPDDLPNLVEDVRSGAEEARDERGRTPLVIIDDLERLLLLSGARPVELLFSRLNDVLAADAVPCLIAVATPGPTRTAETAEGLSAQTLLTLVSTSVSDEGFSHGRLEIEANAATGWTGALPLLLDRCSGVFA